MVTNELYSKLLRVARSYTRNDADAEDAVQNSMLRLLTADLAGIENFEAFACQCVKFSCFDLLTKRKKKRETEIPENFELASPAVSAAVDIEWITNNENLDDRQRQIVVLVLNGHSFSQVAEMLGVAKSTISEQVGKIRSVCMN